MVRNEILQGNDSLKEWMKKLDIKNYIDHRNPKILDKYSQILNYLRNNDCYKSSALAEWAKESVADPWLIATAAVHNYTIITFEKSNPTPSAANPSKKAKIPDMAKVFHVKTAELYFLMRELNFKF